MPVVILFNMVKNSKWQQETLKGKLKAEGAIESQEYS
jgi:hypothetical protein